MTYFDAIIPELELADKLIKEVIIRSSPVYREEFGPFQDVLVPLYMSLHSTSESILILLEHQALYDADVLLRTVIEGTIKYCFLMTGDQEVRAIKYIEYKTVLPNANKVKDHRKAVEAIKKLKKFSLNDIRPFELSLLTDDEINSITEEFPQKTIKQVRTRWEFINMLTSLSQQHPEYEAQLGMNYAYSLASHFAHFDWESINMKTLATYESAHDVTPEADIAHALRIISNVLVMGIFRTVEFLRGNNLRDADLVELCKSGIKKAEALDAKAQRLLDSLFSFEDK